MSIETVSPIQKLDRDLRKASATLSDKEASFLVMQYYNMQDQRIHTGNQLRTIDAEFPHEVLSWFNDNAQAMENNIKIALDVYSANHPVGQWMRRQKGIGPVLASGVLSFIDIHKAPTAGHIWSYAGLTPNQVRRKGVKVNWSPPFKKLCWLISESFVKVSGRDDAYYGKIYRDRKEYEVARNNRGENAETAANILATTKIGTDTKARAALEAGKLPDAQLHSRAKRYAVKIFLSHVHDKLYRHTFNAPPPKPFALEHMGHAHYFAPPD